MVEWRWNHGPTEWYSSRFSAVMSAIDFQFAMYRINNVEYTEYSEEFVETFNKAMMWQALQQ